jgi:hypothetical protein
MHHVTHAVFSCIKQRTRYFLSNAGYKFNDIACVAFLFLSLLTAQLRFNAADTHSKQRGGCISLTLCSRRNYVVHIFIRISGARSLACSFSTKAPSLSPRAPSAIFLGCVASRLIFLAARALPPVICYLVLSNNFIALRFLHVRVVKFACELKKQQYLKTIDLILAFLNLNFAFLFQQTMERRK